MDMILKSFKHGKSVVFHGDNAIAMEKDIPELLKGTQIALSFLDPPFNQDKDYENHDDSMDKNEYWNWMKRVCESIYNLTTDGGSIYFMHREKKTEDVLGILRSSGWTFQSLD